ncbi:MAG: bifunctional nuclease domain-containing protein, partial [bacterium]
GGKLQKVVIDKLENNTFHAKLYILKEDGQEVVIDSRPSDSVAIALRAQAPVFAEDEILKTASVYEV